MTGLWIVLGAVVLGYIWYMTLVSRRNKVQEALSGIDVQLTKRHDLIPNILKIAQRFMEHEKGIFEEITDLRSRAQAGIGARDSAKVGEHLQAESALQARMLQLFAVAENYPTLKSDTSMLQAQTTYNEVEEHIAASRRFYNSAVNSLNNAIQIFPGSLIAAIAGVKTFPFYEAPESARAPVDADSILRRTA